MAVYQLTLKLQDSYFRTSRKTLEMTAADNLTALADVTTIIAAFEAVSGMEVLKYFLSEYASVSDTVTALSNKDAGLTLSVRKQDTDLGVLKIPAPEAALMQANGQADLTNAALIAYVALFQSGGQLKFSDGEIVQTLIGGQLDT